MSVEPNVPAPDRSYESIHAGDEACFSRVIGEAEVSGFAALTGDYNPLHMDGRYAATTRFGDRVAHGLLVASYFSTLVGMHLPGKRALFLSQDLSFVQPVHLGDRITFRGRVRRKTDGSRLLNIDISAINDSREEVIRGRARVMVLP